CVTDNGSGIPPEVRKRIFDPFFTTKPVGQGTGLGLSLCHGIIAAHNGTISVSSEMSSGTTFIISLPIVARTDAHANACIAAPAAAPGPSLRILIVDDNPDVAQGFAEILMSQGHAVEIAHNSREALRQIVTGDYAVVVTDMRMPDLDGPSLYREVTARRPLLGESFLF